MKTTLNNLRELAIYFESQLAERGFNASHIEIHHSKEGYCAVFYIDSQILKTDYDSKNVTYCQMCDLYNDFIENHATI